MDHQIDVIVLSHNAWEISFRFLDVFFQHTPEHLFHITWVDNGSSDDTVDNLSNLIDDNNWHHQISVYPQDKNLGVIGGRNEGYRLAKGAPFLFIIDNDQFVSKDWFISYTYMMNHGYDIIGCEAWRLSKSLWPAEKISNIKRSFSYVGCGGMMIKKKVCDDVGLFDPIFNPCYFEDPDFCLKSHFAGYRIGWNVKHGITHLPHQTLGKMQNKERLNQLMGSHNKFVNKWKHKILPEFKQEELEIFNP